MRQRAATAVLLAALTTAGILAGCTTSAPDNQAQASSEAVVQSAQDSTDQQPPEAPAQQNTAEGENGTDTQPGETTDKGFTATDKGRAITETLVAADAFTEADLEQTVDAQAATALAVADGQDTTISEAGVYKVSGTAKAATIVVDAPADAVVKLVLEGVSITNEDAPVIVVKSAADVQLVLEGENKLEVTGEFAADSDVEAESVIHSEGNLCLKGSGSLEISSSADGITAKDTLKITGGTYRITAEAGSALKAKNAIRIADGTFTLKAEDGIKAKNDDDNEYGYIYIKDGNFDIESTENGLQGYAFVQIDGGTFKLSGAECIEGTYVQINGGTIDIDASEDGINASIKSSLYTPTFELVGGEVTIKMAQGDTDAVDSNGYLYIRGGKLDITAQSAFDYSWGVEMTGGEVYVNGEKVTKIEQSMMGPGGGRGGQPPTGENGTPPEPPSGDDANRPQPPTGESGTPPEPPNGDSANAPQPPSGSTGAAAESSSTQGDVA